MCGIFGVWNFKEVRGSELHQASALLRHRGPDDEGFLVVNSGEVSSFSGKDTVTQGLSMLPNELSCANALVHRRLSILDLSEKGHQPMQARGRNIHIVFNGEVYNFKELIEQHQLEVLTGTDTEVILLMYAKFGASCFQEFRGMWALAILDVEKGELLLCRDRFGIKPLYFAEAGGGLAFSSEIKPLLTLKGIEPTLERKKLFQFLTFGATDDPHETFFDAIQAVPPGSHRVWKLDSMESAETKWYDLRKQNKSQSASGQNFEKLFGESIREHLIADVEIGSCLSGGLDSSAIVAYAASTSKAFKTFTCAFPGEAIDESDFARKLLDIHPDLDQHFTTPTSDSFFQHFDELVLSQERPIGSASVFAQYAVMKLAADNNMKVLLDGQGADEVLGGYYPFAGAYLLGLLRRGKFLKFRRELVLLKSNFNPGMGKAMLRAAFYHLPQSLQIAARKKGRLGASLIAEKYGKEASTVQSPQRGSSDFRELTLRSVQFGLYELLHYEDRNSMHFSIESRVPFLDHRLVEWALHQSPDALIKEGWTKHPVRKLLENAGIPVLAWRKDKLGFVAPQNRWRTELIGKITEKLEAKTISEVFDQKALSQIFTADIRSNEHLSEFWRVYALLRWLDLFKVKLV